jgi:hypothetical protein
VEVTAPGFLVRVHVPCEGRPLRATLPVGTVHVGWVLAPTTGAAGAAGTAFITTLPVSGETHPKSLVTVKVYVPGAKFETVVEVPVPVEVTAPGFLVRVHVPEEGRPLSATLPVGTAQVGWVLAPTTGAGGAEGTALILTLPVEGETQNEASVTVKVYVPGVRFETMVEVPVPVEVTAPGFLVRVHVPDEGRPLRATLPVGTAQVGWVLAPTTGAVGAAGTALITTFPVGGETHPEASVTVKV